MANEEPLIGSIEVKDRSAVGTGGYPWNLPAVAALAESRLPLNPTILLAYPARRSTNVARMG